MTGDRSELIRSAFEDDALVAADRERLWGATQQRLTRQARARRLVRAGAVLAALLIAAIVFLLSIGGSSSDRRPLGPIARAADSMSTDSVERSMIQDKRPDVPSNLIPLLPHRASLQMDLRDLETRQLQLAQALDRTSGREKDATASQLKSVEQQIQATKVAMNAIDAQLAAQPAVAVPAPGGAPVAHTFTEIPPTPPQIFQLGGSIPEEAIWAAGGAGVLLALTMAAMLVYLRRVARSTRERLSAVELQVSSQHATLASGIEAIAIEVERLGEGQRFMSKVLSSGEARLPAPRTS